MAHGSAVTGDDLVYELQYIFYDTSTPTSQRILLLVRFITLHFHLLQQHLPNFPALQDVCFLLPTKLIEWNDDCQGRPDLEPVAAALAQLTAHYQHPHVWQTWSAPDLLHTYQRIRRCNKRWSTDRDRCHWISNLHQGLCHCRPFRQSPAVFATHVDYITWQIKFSPPSSLWRHILHEYTAKWDHVRCQASVCGRFGVVRPCLARLPEDRRLVWCRTHEKKRQRLQALLERQTCWPSDLVGLVVHYTL